MTAYLSIIVCIIGAIVYLASKNAEVKEMGRISFAFGLLAFLIVNGSALITPLR
jgi:Na+/phosphate symporter